MFSIHAPECSPSMIQKILHPCSRMLSIHGSGMFHVAIFSTRSCIHGSRIFSIHISRNMSRWQAARWVELQAHRHIRKKMWHQSEQGPWTHLAHWARMMMMVQGIPVASIYGIEFRSHAIKLVCVLAVKLCEMCRFELLRIDVHPFRNGQTNNRHPWFQE